jgi:hypothetical protein
MADRVAERSESSRPSSKDVLRRQVAESLEELYDTFGGRATLSETYQVLEWYWDWSSIEVNKPVHSLPLDAVKQLLKRIVGSEDLRPILPRILELQVVESRNSEGPAPELFSGFEQWSGPERRVVRNFFSQVWEWLSEIGDPNDVDWLLSSHSLQLVDGILFSAPSSLLDIVLRRVAPETLARLVVAPESRAWSANPQLMYWLVEGGLTERLEAAFFENTDEAVRTSLSVAVQSLEAWRATYDQSGEEH